MICCIKKLKQLSEIKLFFTFAHPCPLQWWQHAPSAFLEVHQRLTDETPAVESREGPGKAMQTVGLATICHFPSVNDNTVVLKTHQDTTQHEHTF